jgi:DNA invertase Pin-like site-specific DNA recombinase
MKAAIWTRVSTEDQHFSNQLSSLNAYAEYRGLEVVQTYNVQESAWKGAHRVSLSQVYAQARAGMFQVLLVWALDRLSREGVQATLEIVDRLARYGVQVWSVQEQWTEADGASRELLLSITAWVARQESERRSERTKAGLERAKANGKALGRPAGAKDKKRRKQSGYFARWADRRENAPANDSE